MDHSKYLIHIRNAREKKDIPALFQAMREYNFLLELEGTPEEITEYKELIFTDKNIGLILSSKEIGEYLKSAHHKNISSSNN